MENLVLNRNKILNRNSSTGCIVVVIMSQNIEENVLMLWEVLAI